MNGHLQSDHNVSFCSGDILYNGSHEQIHCNGSGSSNVFCNGNLGINTLQQHNSTIMNIDCLSIGVDLGGSHVTVVIVNTLSGDVLVKYTTEVSLEERKQVQWIVEKISDCIISALHDKIVEKIVSSAGSNCMISIGIGVPGNVDPIMGVTRYLPNFGWLDKVPLRDALLRSLGSKINTVKFKPLNMRNDGRCAALAEAKYGAGKFSPVFSMLTLGTGIGGALVLDGKVFDGCSFDAGDFGHHTIRSGNEAFDCVCGKRGCFETHCSAQGLVRHYKRLGGVYSLDYGNAEYVLGRMRGGDEVARAAFDLYLDDLSTGLANLVSFYNPDTIAIGGGLAQSPELFERLQGLVDKKLLPATRDSVMVVPSLLGPDAGAIGAALVGMLPN